jgi:hypothetical protein
MDTTHSKTSMFFASLGWIILVGGVAAFLWIGKPYYYEIGRTHQLQEDIEKVNQDLGFDLPEDAPLTGTIESIGDNSFILDAELVFDNPLVDTGDVKKEIVITNATSIDYEKYISPLQFQQLLAEAEEEGQLSETVSPFELIPSSFEELEVGQTVSVTPAPGQSRYEEKIEAQLVRSQIYTDQEGNIVEPQGTTQ